MVMRHQIRWNFDGAASPVRRIAHDNVVDILFVVVSYEGQTGPVLLDVAHLGRVRAPTTPLYHDESVHILRIQRLRALNQVFFFDGMTPMYISLHKSSLQIFRINDFLV